MKQRVVEFSPEAEEDLIKLHDYLVARAGRKVANDYIGRIESFCMSLDLAAERGTLRDDVRKGLRVVGFERRMTVAFTVDADRVVILKLFTAGQNWEAVDW